MKLYTVDYWVPFPYSEYGGLCVVAAENVDQVVKVCLDATDDWHKDEDEPEVAESIRKSCTVIGTTDLFDTPCIVKSFET